MLAGLAPLLPPGLLAQAVAAADAIATSGFRAEGLSVLAPYLPEPDRRPVLAQALAAADSANADGGTFSCDRALARLAPHLPPALLVAALAVAVAITSEYHRAEALAGLASHLPPGLLTEAVAAAAAITDSRSRARALTALAQHLPEPDRPPVLAQALAAANNSYHVQALTELAPHLPPGLLAQALTAAASDDNASSRDQVLTRLVPHLPPSLLVQALAIAPRNGRVPAAVLERAWALHAPGTQLSYVVFLRDRLAGADREACLATLATAAPAIAATGGQATVSQIVQAVTDAYRWWA